MKRLKSADMGKYSGFGCGGVAGSLYELDNLDELRETIGYLKSRGRSYYILGKGYNTLIKEGKINRDIITLKKDFTKISARGCFFNAGAGAGLGELLKEAAKNNLAGLEFLSGIPGTVGAAVCLNSGTADSYIGDLIQTVTLFNSENMEINILKKQDAGFSYRKSDIGKNNIITGCELCLKRGVKSDIINNYRKNLIQKKINQPLDKKSCGCIFKNPKNSDFTAGQLIDKAGFKGKTTGGAEVSMKHANFITNRGNASSRDIYSLIDEIYKGVKGKFGVELELELKLLGYEK